MDLLVFFGIGEMIKLIQSLLSRDCLHVSLLIPYVPKVPPLSVVLKIITLGPNYQSPDGNYFQVSF